MFPNRDRNWKFPARTDRGRRRSNSKWWDWEPTLDFGPGGFVVTGWYKSTDKSLRPPYKAPGTHIPHQRVLRKRLRREGKQDISQQLEESGLEFLYGEAFFPRFEGWGSWEKKQRALFKELLRLEQEQKREDEIDAWDWYKYNADPEPLDYYEDSYDYDPYDDPHYDPHDYEDNYQFRAKRHYDDAYFDMEEYNRTHNDWDSEEPWELGRHWLELWLKGEAEIPVEHDSYEDMWSEAYDAVAPEEDNYFSWDYYTSDKLKEIEHSEWEDEWIPAYGADALGADYERNLEKMRAGNRLRWHWKTR